MRTLPVGGSAQIERRVSSNWIRVMIEDATGTMIPHAPASVEYEQPSADAPISAATLVFRRGEGASSYAPLMTSNPPLQTGRAFTVEIDAGDGAWTPIFSGRIDRWAAPGRYGDVTIEGRDLAGGLEDTQIETERGYGSEVGTPLEGVIQEVADDNLDNPPTLYVPTPTLAVVTAPPEYVPSDVSVYQSHQYLADSIGAAIHYRWVADLPTYTLFQPERSKAVADHTFAPGDYYEVTTLEQDLEGVRNVVEVEYSDRDGVRRRVKVEDPVSIAKYRTDTFDGRYYMRINLASDDVIRDATPATALANAALSDLSEPDATLEIECAYFWPGEVGADLYRFEPNGKHFSAAQQLAPTSIRHRLAIGERPTSWVRVRGKPTAGVLLWRRRARETPDRSEPASAYAIRDIVWTHGAVNGSLDWKVGPAITDELLGFALVDTPYSAAAWDTVAESVLPVGEGEPPVTLPTPQETADTSQRLLVQIEARYLDSATGTLKVGDIKRVTIEPKTFVPGVDPETGEVTQIEQPLTLHAFPWPGSALDTADIRGVIREGLGEGVTLRAWVNKDSYDSPDPGAAPDGEAVLAATPASFGPFTDFGAAGFLLDEIKTHPAEPKTIYLEAVAADGRTSGQIAVMPKARLSRLINELGELDAISALGWANFTPPDKPPLFFADAAAREAALGDAEEGRYAWQADDSSEWQKSGGAWVPAEFPEHLKAFLIVGLVRASALDVDVFEAVSAHIQEVMVTEAWVEVLNALKANVVELSEIVDDMGIVVSGKLQNASGSAIFDLDATGDEPNLLLHDWLQISENGGIYLGDAPFVLAAANDYTDAAVAGSGSGTGNLVIRSATQPSVRPGGGPLVAGDIWLDTSDGDLPHSWSSGGSWVRMYTRIDGGLIETGTVDASVFRTSMSIGATLNSDPTITSIDAWESLAGSTGFVTSVGNAGRAGTAALQSQVDGGQWYVFSKTRVPVEATKTYRASAWARNSFADPGDGVFYLVVVLRDAAGNRIDGDGTGFWYYPRPAIALGTTFQHFEGTFGQGTAHPFPSNAATMQIGCFLNAGGTTGAYQAQGIRLEEVIPGTLIKDNTITTGHLQADSVTADKISVTDLSAINATFSGEMAGNHISAAEVFVEGDMTFGTDPLNPTLAKGGIRPEADGVDIWSTSEVHILTGDIYLEGGRLFAKFLLGGTLQERQIEVGAPDSGGTGYRSLRILN